MYSSISTYISVQAFSSQIFGFYNRTLRRLVMGETTKKVIKGFKWTTIQTIIVGIIGPATLIIQAWYLPPKEMAYIAIIMIVIGLLHVIENMGMSQAIIQNEKFNNNVFTSIFFINITISFIIGGM